MISERKINEIICMWNSWWLDWILSHKATQHRIDNNKLSIFTTHSKTFWPLTYKSRSRIKKQQQIVVFFCFVVSKNERFNHFAVGVPRTLFHFGKIHCDVINFVMRRFQFDTQVYKLRSFPETQKMSITYSKPLLGWGTWMNR